MAIEKIIIVKVKDKGVDKLNKKLTTTNKKVVKVKQSTKEMGGALDRATGGATSRFISMGKSVLGVAKGFKVLRFAIISSGIGALLIAIIAIGAAFKNSEAGQNKFAKLMGVIGSVIGNIVDVIADLGNFIIDLFSGDGDAVKSLVSFGKKIFNVVGLPIKNIIDTVKTLGKVLGALFSGDISGAFDALKDGIGDIKENFDEAKDSIIGAKDALVDFAKEIADDARKAQLIADQRAKADLIDRKLTVETAQAAQDIADLRFKSEQRDRFAAGERVKFLKEASQIAEDISEKQLISANLRLNAQIEENKLSGSQKADLNKVAELQAVVINLDTQKLNLQKRLITSITTFQREEIAGINKIANEKKKKLEEEKKSEQKKIDDAKKIEKKRLEDIDKIRETFRLKNEDLEDTTELQKIEREQERALAELERLKASEDEKFELLKFFKQKTFDVEIEIEAKNKIARIKIAEDEQKEKDRIALIIQERDQRARLQSRQALNDLAFIFGEQSKIGKAAAITGILVDQAGSVSRAISALLIANTKAIAASPLTLGQPFVTINTISTALGIAAGVVAAKKAISEIGGGGGGSISSPSFRQGGQSAPSFNVVGTSGANQLAQTLSAKDQPIQAFVVGSNVTTQQALDRNIVQTATIG